MVHFIFGVLATNLFWWLIGLSKKREIDLSIWKKVFIAAGILYAVFVSEVIVGFVFERELKAALVMGMTTGVFAIIWGVLIWRFVFDKGEKITNTI